MYTMRDFACGLFVALVVPALYWGVAYALVTR